MTGLHSPQEPHSAFIAIEGLSKVYQKNEEIIRPLDELSLEVRAGEFLALMGPSGSGKTTLLNLLAGLDEPSAGQLRIGEQVISKLTRSQRTRWRSQEVGYVFQLYHLVPVLSAWENVELPLFLQPLSRRERRQKVEAALRQVGLVDRAGHRPGELSGGQAQRVAIARAIVHDPTLLVADEPTGDLDRESASGILQLLRQLAQEEGKTIVMVTHDPRAAEAADRCLHLEKGRLVEGGEK